MGFDCWLLQQSDISRNTLIQHIEIIEKCILLPNSFTNCHQKEFSHSFLHYLVKARKPRRRDRHKDNLVCWSCILLKEIKFNTITSRLELTEVEDKDRKILP